MKYIENAKIGLYETWLINGVGLETVAYLKGGKSSNQIKYDTISEIVIAIKKAPI